MIKDAEDNVREFCEDEIFIARFKHEIKTSGKSVVDSKLQQCIKMGTLPPFIVTPLAMGWISRNENLKNRILNNKN